MVVKQEKNHFEYEIIQHLGVLKEDTKGWRKEVNVISYNGKEPVIDIRNWTPQNTMSRGITLSRDAFSLLLDVGKDYVMAEKENK